MIFVDTSAWCAAFIRSDTAHDSADAWLRGNTDPLVTTDYVIDETLTVIRMRGYPQLALRVGERLLVGRLAFVERITPHDLRRAWFEYHGYHNKQWSFTDCTSRAVMERLNVRSAFAFDDDFRQFGTVAVLPQSSNPQMSRH